MPGYKKLTPKKVEEAIIGSFGNKKLIAEKCNCTYNAIYDFFIKHPEFNEILEKERSKIVQLAENKLYEIALQGDIRNSNTLNANIKILNALGGKVWNEKQIIESKNLNVNIDLDKEVNDKIISIIDKVRNGEGK